MGKNAASFDHFVHDNKHRVPKKSEGNLAKASKDEMRPNVSNGITIEIPRPDT